jgi:redox-sensitive bicupin YhaK (pirin superfamily)
MERRSPVSVARTFEIQRSKQRAYFDHGWLKTHHSFSFAEYHDPRNVNWGALRVFNDDIVEAGQGFPTHPHRDMEIITYVLNGRLEHLDSTGSRGVVGPGGVQFMSAGTGIRHSEYNNSKTEPLHFLQMWVLPGRLGVKPSYGQVEFTLSDRLNKWLPVASGRGSVSAPVALTQDAAFFVTRLENDCRLRYAFDPNRLGFLFAAEGAARVEGFDDDGGVVGGDELGGGDAVRMSNAASVSVRGQGEFVLWDVPRMPDGAND